MPFSFYSIHKQQYLGGDSNTMMFVNISPYPSLVPESLCSLRFYATANACEIKRRWREGGKDWGNLWGRKNG
jgi:hypothetical protein